MIKIRRSADRGHADHGWLDTHHTFSFANFYDPEQMGFRSLRVMNEDRVAAARGFGAHPHKDMEIVSYVVSGKLAHRDSMGHEEVLGPNEIQRMSAGTGVRHSEFNGSETEPAHFFQVWLEPAVRGTEPSYEQVKFAADEKRDRFRLLASPEKVEGAVVIGQDARMSVAELRAGKELRYALEGGRGAWLQVVSGAVRLNGAALAAGDGASVEGEPELRIEGAGAEASEVLLFDLA